MRISVIQRLEEYLGIHPDGSVEDFPPLEYGEMRDIYDVEPTPPPFEPFKDLCKRRFLWYLDSYLLSINEAEKSVKPNQNFVSMPFEGSGNGMPGKFNYPELRKRLGLIHSVLYREIDYWAEEGFMQVRKDTSLASMLGRQFERIVESYKQNDMVTVDIDLVNQNPFVWRLTYFGRPMTNLDGGMFRIKLAMSPRFPEEQPRVIVETKLFHHRISKGGVLCYFPKRPDDLKSHVEAVIDAIEDTETPYDPRTLVNPEASKLYWGSADDKKLYSRQLRRAVQRSVEYAIPLVEVSSRLLTH